MDQRLLVKIALFFNCQAAPFQCSSIFSPQTLAINEMATLSRAMLADVFFFFGWPRSDFFQPTWMQIDIMFVLTIHTLSPLSQIFTAIISRSHCGESLLTGTKIFSTPSNFSIMHLLDTAGSTLWKYITSVSQHPTGPCSSPSGPKLICWGQIVCKGKI